MGQRGSLRAGEPPSGRLPRLERRRPRSFTEWRTLRRWGRLPPWEVEAPGFLLREARLGSGLTQEALADRLGITQQAVSRAERWGSNPTIELMRRWLSACGHRLELRVVPFPPAPAVKTGLTLQRRRRQSTDNGGG
jgi:DNA-binding XRE family transcriptional regulator